MKRAVAQAHEALCADGAHRAACLCERRVVEKLDPTDAPKAKHTRRLLQHFQQAVQSAFVDGHHGLLAHLGLGVVRH
jgi:hypothetical protein